MGPGLWVLMGMLAFFVMEKLLHIFRAGHAHGDHGDGHRHDHSNGAGVEPKALLPQSPVVGRRRKLKAKAAEAESQDGEAAATGHGEVRNALQAAQRLARRSRCGARRLRSAASST